MRDVAGIFVGGRASRMGGVAKGLLRVPGGDSSIVEHLAAIVTRAGLDVVLVGAHEAYARLPWSRLSDDPSAAGPIGGLLSVLRNTPDSKVFVLSCDQPFVDDETFARLVTAPDSVATAPRIDDRWQPFFARYDASRALPHLLASIVDGQRSLQSVLDRCGATALELGPLADRLRDWDTPEDVTRDGGRVR